jgi:hypothetical protein
MWMRGFFVLDKDEPRTDILLLFYSALDDTSYRDLHHNLPISSLSLKSPANSA